VDTITVSAKGQIAIPKAIREQLGLEEGTRLDLQVDGTTITLTKSQDWRRLYGAAAGTDLLDRYEQDKQEERQREDDRS
jgi:AbrB family looped-hinge helix DNA binding protein